MNKPHIESLKRLKLYKKEIVLIGLYQYQIKAIVDFGSNKITYQVGDLHKTTLTDDLNKAIELITELVENNTTCI